MPARQRPDGHSLVFVGDLCDRDPDSPGVVVRVSCLMEAGCAMAVMGNQELDLLRSQRKHGNDWFWSEDARRDVKFALYVALEGADQHAKTLAFFEHLPLVVPRPDLRAVHAAWHPSSLQRLQGLWSGAPVSELFAWLGHGASRQIQELLRSLTDREKHCTSHEPHQGNVGHCGIPTHDAPTGCLCLIARALACTPAKTLRRRCQNHCSTHLCKRSMNRNDLATLLAETHQLPKASAAKVLSTVIDALCTELKKGNSVALAGFGTFKLGQRAARTGRNPATGDKIKIAARKLVKFSPSTSLAGLVDPKFAKARADKAAAKQASPAKKGAAKTTAAPAKKAAAKKAAAKKKA